MALQIEVNTLHKVCALSIVLVYIIIAHGLGFGLLIVEAFCVSFDFVNLCKFRRRAIS